MSNESGARFRPRGHLASSGDGLGGRDQRWGLLSVPADKARDTGPHRTIHNKE